MKQATDFARLISQFLNNYLPNEKGMSLNTIKSYTYTFILFIRFMRDIRKKRVEELAFTHLSKETILSFLDWIQKERNCSDTTRDQRLAAISSFIKYAEYMHPEKLDDCHQILSIPSKKVGLKNVEYLTSDGIKLLLQQPDLTKTKGLRDLAILSLMYESAARVQEIINLTPGSLFIENKPYRVVLHGKGNKQRVVPLPDGEVEILRRYMNEARLLNRENAQSPLFPNYQTQKMTRNAINNILIKYVKIAREISSSLIGKHLSCHSIRHSKAMQLLEANVELIHIRDFLGHKSVLTTEVYARANPKYTFNAIKNAYKNITPENLPEWAGNAELMAMLKGLTR